MAHKRSQGDVSTPLCLHIPMGATGPQKVANMMAGLERGIIAPPPMIVPTI